jgi:branched-chain amino acid transport system ATP-binding protein
MTTAAALAVAGIEVRFGGITAVNGMSLDVPAGGRVGLIGANGAGKSTLVDVICAYRRPHAGTVALGGTDILRRRPRQLRGIGIGRTFQHCELFWNMTVADNVLIGSGGDRAVARRWLDAVGVAELRDAYVNNTAYGVQKRVELARALAGGVSLLVLDEPASGLNSHEKEEFAEILLAAQRENGFGLLMIEHDMRTISTCCTEVYVMDAGRGIFRGTPDEAMADPRVVEAYLGTRSA